MRADVVRLTTIDGGRMKDDIPLVRRFWGLISDQNLELEDLLPNTLHCAMLWSGPSLLSFRPPPSIGLSLGVIVIRAVNDSGLESAPEYVLEYVLGL